MAGLTTSGLVVKTLQEVRLELRNSFRASYGNSINLAEDSVLGNQVDIISEQLALLWEALEDVYNAFNPNSANGTALDALVAITGIERLNATPSTATVTAFGTAGTVIPISSRVAVADNPDIVFETDAEYTILAGTDEVQTITFSATPDAGEFTLNFDGDETNSILYTDNAATIQSELNALAGLSAVTVSGSFAAGFEVTFAGADGEQDQELLQEGSTNTLEASSVAVTITITETTQGVLPQVDMEMTCQTDGAFEAAFDSITEIIDTVSGWDSASNALDADVGTDIETDAELRLRRLQTLANPGVATQDAIRARVLEIDGVLSCTVYSNRTNSTDADGRPAKSFEVVVQGGDEEEIAQTIWDSMPIGIESFGSSSQNITDSQGFERTIYFSRPTEIDIYLEVDILTNTEFPSGGDTSIKSNILEYAQSEFFVGYDVVTTKLFEPVHDVDGIDDVDFRISTSLTALVQVLTFDADFVSGNLIDGKIAGTSFTQVPFNSDHATTISDLATEIQGNALVTTAVADAGARTVTVTSATAGVPAPLSSIAVTGGSSQANSEIETASHSDDNIDVGASEVSAWDTSRIIVTEI